MENLNDGPPEKVRAGDLKPHPFNAKMHDVPFISGSIRELGWVGVVIADRRTGFLLAGHGTTDAVLDVAGEDEMVDVQWVRTRDDEHAMQLLHVLNAAQERAGYDPERLIAAIDHLRSVAADPDAAIEFTGFDPQYLDNLRTGLSSTAVTDLDAEWIGMPEFDMPDRKGITVTVHFKDDDDADAFFELLGKPRKGSFWWPAHDGHVGSSVEQGWEADVDGADGPNAAEPAVESESVDA